MLAATLKQRYQPLNAAQAVDDFQLYFQDESRFGLMTVQRRRLTLKGVKPIGPFQQRFDNTYLYGMISPQDGDSFFMTIGGTDTAIFQQYLNRFAEHRPRSFKIILLDQASYHKAKALEVPQNMALIFIPPATPELNPAERVWQEMKADVAWKNFEDLEQLQQWIEERIEAFSNEQLISLTNYPFVSDAMEHPLVMHYR